MLNRGTATLRREAPPGFATDTLVALLRQRAWTHSDETAYTYLREGDGAEQTLSYGELETRARAIAARLQAWDMAGQRAVLLYQPGLEFIAAFFGCLYAGVIAAPVYAPRRNGSLERVHSVTRDSAARVMLTTSQVLANFDARRLLPPSGRAPHWLATDTVESDEGVAWVDSHAEGDDLAFLQYTSGSTAAPKGVMLSHINLLHNLRLIHARFGCSEESRGVIWLPPYHDMGLIGGVLVPLYGGFPVVLMSPVTALQRPLRWLQAISKYRATISGGPNFAYELCLNKIKPEQREGLDLSSWQVAFNGAEPLRGETLERFAATFAPCGFRTQAWYPCYGLAEATLFVTGAALSVPPQVRNFDAANLEVGLAVEVEAPTSPVRRLVGSGRPSASEAVVIVDAATHTALPPGAVGEIWVAGPSVARGYWQRHEESKESFGARVRGEEGSYMRTGDLGFMHEGELYVTGRSKELIIIRGHNHYPQDIELTAARSHSALADGRGAAFAVDGDGEEQLVLVHEVDRHAAEESYHEIIAAVRGAISQEHQLQTRDIVLVKRGVIPVTSSGKVQRNACRARWLARELRP